MRNSTGQVVELLLQNGFRYARISCPANLVPAPGQYVLSGIASSLDLLPVPLYSTESTPQGFISLVPDSWFPGQEISLRGPLGRGFALPPSARRVGLIALDGDPSRLCGLIDPALKQGAAVALVTDFRLDAVRDEVEVHPMVAMRDVMEWADYLAFDVTRETLPEWRGRLGSMKQVWVGKEAQILVCTMMPCGGIADCGVCAVAVRSGWVFACKDGPVFPLNEA